MLFYHFIGEKNGKAPVRYGPGPWRGPVRIYWKLECADSTPSTCAFMKGRDLVLQRIIHKHCVKF